MAFKSEVQVQTQVFLGQVSRLCVHLDSTGAFCDWRVSAMSSKKTNPRHRVKTGEAVVTSEAAETKDRQRTICKKTAAAWLSSTMHSRCDSLKLDTFCQLIHKGNMLINTPRRGRKFWVSQHEKSKWQDEKFPADPNMHKKWSHSSWWAFNRVQLMKAFKT